MKNYETYKLIKSNKDFSVYELCNNQGSAISYSYAAQNEMPSSHKTSAKNWVESVGFKYLSAHNKTELDNGMAKMIKPNNKPMLIEVFTDKKTDYAIFKKLKGGVK